MPRQPTRQQRGGRYHHGNLRAALIHGAVELVVERGVSGFSLAEVSRRLGVAVCRPVEYVRTASRADDDAIQMFFARGMLCHLVITLEAPSLALTHTEMAAALSRALGRSITFRDVPPEASAPALAAAGMPSWQVEGLPEDYAHYRRGEAALVSSAVQEVTGQAPHTFDDFARDYAAAFAEAAS